MLVIKTKHRGKIVLKPNVPPSIPDALKTSPTADLDYDTLLALAEIGRIICDHPITIDLIEINKTHVRLGFDAAKSIGIDHSQADPRY